MALIDTNALREYYKINEHCEECHWNSRDCSKPPYYSLRDICAAIDEMPTIPAIPVEWLHKKREQMIDAAQSKPEQAIAYVLWLWKKEQEAR